MSVSRCALVFWILASCGRPESVSTTQEAIDPRNDPQYMDRSNPRDLERQFSQLPTQGNVAQRVWTGHWWPSANGGTSQAMAKYDRAVGQGNLAQTWEREHSASHNQSWAGHCNGLAAAGINTREPVRAVQYGGVTFSVSDIKALLIELYQGPGSNRVIGGRCRSGTGTDQWGRPSLSWCRDLNPGAFHIALANYLGRHGTAFIVDKSANAEVWNYPAVGFSSNTRPLTRARATQLVASGSSTYPFNDDAVSFVSVGTRVDLATGSALSLQYLLELDADGQIIGGEWIGNSRFNHPDFMWRTTEPSPENPHLDVATVLEIAERSF